MARGTSQSQATSHASRLEMNPDPSEAKAAMRNHMRTSLARLSAVERETAASRARALLGRQPLWAQANEILFFAPLPGEIDLWPLLLEARRKGKCVALPRFVPGPNEHYVACAINEPERDVERGRFGIREPRMGCAELSLNRLDLVLAPGIAYDLHGRRLGRGKGFYDRLLAEVRGVKCGVAFDQQIVPEVPVAPHDILMNCLLTPTRWIEL